MAPQSTTGNAPELIDILRQIGNRVRRREGELERCEARQKGPNEDKDQTELLDEFFRYEELLRYCCKWVSERTGCSEELLVEVARVTEPLDRPDHLAVFPQLHALNRERATAELWQTLLAADRDALVSVNLLRESAPVRAGKEQSDDVARLQAVKRPPENALKAWRLRDLSGITNQSEIAAELTKKGVPATQGQVSRWIKLVEDYMAAGNVLPPINPLTSQPQSIDPDIIDMGERQDGRTPRQRANRDSTSADR